MLDFFQSPGIPPVRFRQIFVTKAARNDLAYVACGRADALVVHNPSSWDIEVGYLLVSEAGGKVTKDEDEIGGDVIICSNARIHGQLSKIISTERYQFVPY